MLSLPDLITLPFTPELTQAGIACLCRCLSHRYGLAETSSEICLPEKLHQIVYQTAAELACRRHLVEKEVPFELADTTPFSNPEHVDLILGGRRAELICTPIFNRVRIRQLRRQPEKILEEAALLPIRQIDKGSYTTEDILIFVFLHGLVAQDVAGMQRALAANLPVDLLHILPQTWRAGSPWRSLGPLYMKSEAAEPIEIEIGGLGENRTALTEQLVLCPLVRTALQSDFYSIAYLRRKTTAAGRTAISSAALRKVHLVDPDQWLNAWIYGMEIILAGYITVGEFRRKAASLPPDSRTFYRSNLRLPQLWLRVGDLHPLQHLFTNVRRWQAAGPD